MRWENRLVDRLGHCRRTKNGGRNQSVSAGWEVLESGGEMTKKEAKASQDRWRIVGKIQNGEHCCLTIARRTSEREI